MVQAVSHTLSRIKYQMPPQPLYLQGQPAEGKFSLQEGEETAPSCCIMPIMSQLAQLSTILPSAMRSMLMPVQLSSLCVGSMPMNSPSCVPIEVNLVATKSPSANCMSIDRVVKIWESFAELGGKFLHGLHTVEILGVFTRTMMLVVDVV